MHRTNQHVPSQPHAHAAVRTHTADPTHASSGVGLALGLAGYIASMPVALLGALAVMHLM